MTGCKKLAFQGMIACLQKSPLPNKKKTFPYWEWAVFLQTNRWILLCPLWQKTDTRLADQLEKASEKEPPAVYHQMVTSLGKEEGCSFLRCIYEGNLSLNAQTAEITLRQCHGSDTLHLRLHNRAANSSEGKNYKGGLAVMLSNSRGKEHMPCVQGGLLSRRCSLT